MDLDDSAARRVPTSVEARERARASVRALMLEALEPTSTVFIDFAAHLGHAFGALTGVRARGGAAAEFQKRLYLEVAACAVAAGTGGQTPTAGGLDGAGVGRRRMSAESLRDLCEAAVPLLDDPQADEDDSRT